MEWTALSFPIMAGVSAIEGVSKDYVVARCATNAVDKRPDLTVTGLDVNCQTI